MLNYSQPDLTQHPPRSPRVRLGGFAHLPRLLDKARATLADWLEEHEYESLAQARGSMSLQKCPNAQAFTRANYMRILNGWRA